MLTQKKAKILYSEKCTCNKVITLPSTLTLPALILSLWAQIEDGMDQLQNKTTCSNRKKKVFIRILFPFSTLEETTVM